MAVQAEKTRRNGFPDAKTAARTRFLRGPQCRDEAWKCRWPFTDARRGTRLDAKEERRILWDLSRSNIPLKSPYGERVSIGGHRNRLLEISVLQKYVEAFAQVFYWASLESETGDMHSLETNLVSKDQAIQSGPEALAY